MGHSGRVYFIAFFWGGGQASEPAKRQQELLPIEFANFPKAHCIVGRGRGTVGKCTGPKWSQNGPNDHFGQNDLILNRILAFAKSKWTKMVHFWSQEVHFGPFRSANRTLAISDIVMEVFMRERDT